MTMFRIPVSTYRLQLNSDLRFADVQALVPYFHCLGITDLYASPFLKARRGSRHGYDVIECRPRFLPLTLKSRLPVSASLIRLYLSSPWKPLVSA